MSQTTTNIGRLSVADPDLGFDTDDGGTALHAQLRANFTAFSDHLISRYKTTTLANGAPTTITHNFGLNLTKLKVLIWESGVLRTDAQVAADYTIAESGGSSTTAIIITNSSGGSKTFVAVVLGLKYGINSSDFDPACSIDTTGNIRAAEIRTTGNDIVINHDAAGSGADWTATIRRQSSGMTGAGVYSLPLATSTLASLELAETLALKTLTGVAGITLAASAAINWAAGSVALGASIGANTLTVAGSSSTVRVPGALSSGTLLTDSDDLVLNNDAAASSADWKATIRRPSSGMTAAGVYTLPIATTTLLSTNLAQVVTLKDIDGGTASDTSRLTIPKNTKSNLDALTRKQGTLVYATDLSQVFIDTGSALTAIGSGGGGGGGIKWNSPSGNGAQAVEENDLLVYTFPDADDCYLVTYVRVPTSYVAGTQINMDIAMYSSSATFTMKLKATTWLIRANLEGVGKTTHNYSSTNTAVTNTGDGDTWEVFTTTLDLSNASGQLNSQAVAAGDLLKVKLFRDYANDTDTGDIRFLPDITTVRFS